MKNNLIDLQELPETDFRGKQRLKTYPSEIMGLANPYTFASIVNRLCHLKGLSLRKAYEEVNIDHIHYFGRPAFSGNRNCFDSETGFPGFRKFYYQQQKRK